MRILYILHAYHNTAGTEEHTKLLIKSLPEDFESFVLFPEKDKIFLYQGQNEICSWESREIAFPVSSLRSEPHEEALHKAIVAVQPDIIHVQHFFNWHLGLLPQLSSMEIPLCVSIHDYFLWTPEFTMQNAIHPRDVFTKRYSQRVFGRDISQYLLQRFGILTEALGKAKKIIIPSEFLREYFPKIISPKVIPHGILPFKVTKSSSQKLRFGFLSNLVPQKGISLLIESFIEANLKDAELHLYGAGSLPKEFPGVFHHGSFTEDKKEEVFSNVDVVVIPSMFQETFSLVLSESFFAKKPVIGSYLGALKDRIVHLKNGMHFDSKQSLIAALRFFAETNDWRKWEYPEIRTATEMTEDYVTLYKEIS